LFTIVGGVGLFSTPGNMFWLVLVTLAIKGIGASLINTVMFGLEAETVEYGEWKSGRRSEGATYALFSFTRKVTQSIGGAVGAWALAIGGYISLGTRWFGRRGKQPSIEVTFIRCSCRRRVRADRWPPRRRIRCRADVGRA
jgi:Na+/melibiose symporter-like transporter